MKVRILSILLTLSLFSICLLIITNLNLHNKVEYYENVIRDFGIEEFINYPELYYQEGFMDQVSTHKCMWAIEDAIDCNNAYEELKGKLDLRDN